MSQKHEKSNFIPKEHDPAYYEVRNVRDESEVAICRVLNPGDHLRSNSPQDRVSIEPKRAQWLAKQGVVLVEIAKARACDIEDAGGVDKFLKANPKKDKLPGFERAQLPPIPGIPTQQDKAKPWDFEVVED